MVNAKFKSVFAILAAILLLANTVSAGFSIDHYNIEKTPANIVIQEQDILIISIYDRGDVDADGNITEYDLFYLIRYLYFDDKAPKYLYLGDYNEDGSVNILDIVGIINNLRDQGIFPDDLANYKKGDVNTDGKINVDDVYFLIDYIYKDGEKPAALYLADFNSDFKINLLDITAIITYLKENNLLDSEGPVIDLVSPDDDTFRTSESKKDIRFKFVVADENEIDYCELIIDDYTHKVFDNPNKGVEIKVTIELDRDDYKWKVMCVDVLGNIGYSDVWDFDIKKKKTTSDDEDEDEGVYYYDNSDDDFYSESYQDTNPIDLGSDDTEVDTNRKSQINFFVEYLVPIFLALFIILILIMLGIVLSRR